MGMTYREVVDGICQLTEYERRRITITLAAHYSTGMRHVMNICHLCNAKVFDISLHSTGHLHKCNMPECDHCICQYCWRKINNDYTTEWRAVIHYRCPLHDPGRNTLFDLVNAHLKNVEYEEIERFL